MRVDLYTFFMSSLRSGSCGSRGNRLLLEPTSEGTGETSGVGFIQFNNWDCNIDHIRYVSCTFSCLPLLLIADGCHGSKQRKKEITIFCSNHKIGL